MSDLGKILIVVGLVIVGIGFILTSGIGKSWFGKLPGDIQVSRGNFSFYFPIVTCLIISVVLTLLFWIFRR